jgi:aryl-alcohol dehydrogenase-like predicted oxidoreductase
MKQRTIGNTGITVSAIGIGCNNFGLRIDTEASRAVIHKALDLGITFWDTADVYGKKGGSETCLGQFLGPRRKDIFLASKFGGPMDDSGSMQGCSRRYIMTAVEASLKRLKTDWLDLYQMHRFDQATPLEETMRALDDLVKQGKVRYLGFSTLIGWPFVDMQWTARQLSTTPLTFCESEYSLLKRDDERDLIPAMVKHGAYLLPYYPLAGGLLSGKYKRNAPLPEGGRITKGARYQDMWLTDANWNVLEKLEVFCAARGRSMIELAFAWLLAQPVLASVIAGATKPEQLENNVRAVEWELTPAEVAEVNEISNKD